MDIAICTIYNCKFCRSPSHSSLFANQRLIPDQADEWEGKQRTLSRRITQTTGGQTVGQEERWQTKRFMETKRTVTLAFLSSIWPGVVAGQHMETPNFDGKSPSRQLWWQTSITPRASRQVLIFPSQPLLSKFPDWHQNFSFSKIPLWGALNIASAWKKKSFLNLESCWQVILSFYALASFRNPKTSLK